MAVFCRKDGRWICYYRSKDSAQKGKTIYEYFGRGPAGEVAARKRDSELNLKETRPRKQKPQGPIFGTLAKEYADKRPFSENSRRHLWIRLEANILPFFGNLPAIRISEGDLDRYIEKRRKDWANKTQKNKKKRRHVKFSTINREITDIKAILSWAVSQKPPMIPINPVKDYKKPPNDDAVIMPPTAAEAQAIIKNAAPHLMRALMLSYYLGLRPGAVELLTITWDRVDLSAGYILVESAHKGGPQLRRVPIHESLIEVLKEWKKADKGRGPVIHYHGRAIKKIQNSWAGALKRAKIKRRIRPYDLRHHFVTTVLEAGADIKAVSDIVGSSPETLRKVYQHVTSKMHRQTVAAMPPLDLGALAEEKTRPRARKRARR